MRRHITRQPTSSSPPQIRIQTSELHLACTARCNACSRRLSTKSVDLAYTQGHPNIRGQHSRSTACLRREDTAVMSTQGDAGIPLSLLAEDRQQSFRLLELPPELLKLLTSDNPPT